VSQSPRTSGRLGVSAGQFVLLAIASWPWLYVLDARPMSRGAYFDSNDGSAARIVPPDGNG
jgi:hypothetical protein